MGSVLKQEGFDVLTAENGHDAIHVSQSHRGKIDLLVSDVTMPGMDGPTLADELTAKDPNLPVLFISGYPERMSGRRRNPFRLLLKPFSASALMLEVNNMLRRRT
jgi:two-component system cell cycle sensor histidine kinase/response regulator CckA